MHALKRALLHGLQDAPFAHSSLESIYTTASAKMFVQQGFAIKQDPYSAAAYAGHTYVDQLDAHMSGSDSNPSDGEQDDR